MPIDTYLFTMNFSISQHNEIITVTPGRTIAYEDLALLRNRLWALVDGKNLAVVLDLKELLSLDTRLVSFIIELKKKLNGNLALAHANDLVKELLAMTRLSDVIILCDSLETA